MRWAVVDRLDGEGETSLFCAASKGFDAVLKALIRGGAEVNRKLRKNGNTALHISAARGHPKCVYTLLSAGADTSVKDPLGASPLHQASQGGHLEAIECLLSGGADVHILDSKGRTPLILALLQGHAKAANLLLDAGADPHKLDTDGRNAMWAASTVAVAKCLLDRGVSATNIDLHGWSVLHLCAGRNSDTGVICALYRAGANPTVLNSHNITAAELARGQGYEDTAKLLDLLAAKYRQTTS